MALTTFSELKSSIADFLNRDDLTSVIPDFIKLAESDINRKIRHWRQENRATAEVDGQYSAIPSDFLEPIRAHIETGDYRSVELLGNHEMQLRRQNKRDATGKPAYYSITQGEIELYPTPDATYNLELYYYARIPALSDSATSNWLLTYAPDVYLYGSLMHSAPYLGEDQRTSVWASLYGTAVEALNAESEQAKFSSATLRMRVRSY